MATLVKVSRKRDKKIRAVRGTVGLLDYDDLKRNFRKGYYYLGAYKSKFQWYFYNVSHQLRTEKSINFSSFFLSLMKIILFLFIYLSHVHIIHAVQKPNENNIQSNTNTCKIQILHFIFNLKNNYQSFKYTIFVFFFFFFIHKNRTSIDSFHKWTVTSIQVPLSRGKRIFHAPRFNIFLFAISIARRNSVLKQSSKTNCIFRVKLVLDRRYPDNWSFN